MPLSVEVYRVSLASDKHYIIYNDFFIEFLEIFPTHDPTQPTKSPKNLYPIRLKPTCGSTQPMENPGPS